MGDSPPNENAHNFTWAVGKTRVGVDEGRGVSICCVENVVMEGP